MKDKITPYFDYDNIETYCNHPLDPPDLEHKVLNVYFSIETTNEEIKLYIKELLKCKKMSDIHENTQGLINKDLLHD